VVPAQPSVTVRLEPPRPLRTERPLRDSAASAPTCLVFDLGLVGNCLSKRSGTFPSVPDWPWRMPVANFLFKKASPYRASAPPPALGQIEATSFCSAV